MPPAAAAAKTAAAKPTASPKVKTEHAEEPDSAIKGDRKRVRTDDEKLVNAAITNCKRIADGSCLKADAKQMADCKVGYDMVQTMTRDEKVKWAKQFQLANKGNKDFTFNRTFSTSLKSRKLETTGLVENYATRTANTPHPHAISSCTPYMVATAPYQAPHVAFAEADRIRDPYVSPLHVIGYPLHVIGIHVIGSPPLHVIGSQSHPLP